MDDSLEFAIQKLIATTKELGITAEIPQVETEKLMMIQQSYDLPSDLIKWYSFAEPGVFIIPRPVQNIHFINSNQFEKSLIGYAYTLKTPSNIILDKSWPSTWVVIGGESEYPVIVMKESSADKSVYYGEAQNGVWKLNILSNNLEGFLIGISEYSSLYLSKYQGKIYKGKLMDNDYSLDQSFVKDFTEILDANRATVGRGEIWLMGWLGL